MRDTAHLNNRMGAGKLVLHAVAWVGRSLGIACAWFGLHLMAPPAAHAQAIAPPIVADLTTGAQERVGASIAAMLESKSVAKGRSANDLGWDCLAATELAARGDARATGRLRLLVGALLPDLVKTPQGSPAGWTATISDTKRCPRGGYDAFGDATCNPPGTAYAFQSGLGIACLARAAGPLGEPRLLDTARQVLASWEPLATTRAPCRGCIYFPASNHANDAGRYVRNMNVFIAFGAASVGAAGDAKAMQIARAAMASELAEQARGNKGYLGVLDPQWIKSAAEADRIENHAASVAVLSRQIAALTGDAAIERHAIAVWKDWVGCDNDRCRGAACSYWAADPERCQATQTAAHCAFRDLEPRARELCLRYLDKVTGVGSFGIWAIGVGTPRR